MEKKKMDIGFPVPPPFPLDECAACGDIEDAALALYQKLADTERAAEEFRRKAHDELRDQSAKSRVLIARLAAERFEFERLARRMEPDLVRLEAAGLLRALDLYRRAWDQLLRRNNIEVCDITGYPLTDEIAEDLEVEGHVPDPAVTQTTIREMLSPLVRLEGKTIGMAKVITSVPAIAEELPQ
jgi:hypothetical protein